jgi:hypothetical protein
VKRTKKKHSFLIISGLVLAFLMLAGNFVSVHATTNATNATLPDFLEKLLEQLYPNATSAELTQIRTEWADQLLIDQEHAPNATGGLSPMYTPGQGGSHLITPVSKEVVYGGEIEGQPNAIAGTEDGVMVQQISGLNEMTNLYGNMSSVNAGGAIYCAGEIGPFAGTGNYLMVWGTNNYDGTPGCWTFIGYGQYTSTYENWVYLGYTSTAYKDMSFSTDGEGGVDPTNTIACDCVWTSNS